MCKCDLATPWFCLGVDRPHLYWVLHLQDTCQTLWVFDIFQCLSCSHFTKSVKYWANCQISLVLLPTYSSVSFTKHKFIQHCPAWLFTTRTTINWYVECFNDFFVYSYYRKQLKSRIPKTSYKIEAFWKTIIILIIHDLVVKGCSNIYKLVI